MTPEEHLAISDLQALAAEAGVVAAPPLKALPWLLLGRKIFRPYNCCSAIGKR